MLTIELILQQTKGYLQQQLPTALNSLTPNSNQYAGMEFSIPAPAFEDYFIGEPSRLVAYNAPAIFVVAEKTTRPGVNTGGEWNFTQRQSHRIMVAVLVEQLSEENLTLAGFRYLEAIDQCLHNIDITNIASLLTPGAWPNSNYSTLTKVVGFDYGAAFVTQRNTQRVFRKDVIANVLVEHWDHLDPMR